MTQLAIPRLKAIPPSWSESEVEALAHQPRPLTEFGTPLVTVDRSALDHNLETMRRWCDSRGVALAPHGKTTMSRQLWEEQLAAGAWGITVATPWQLGRGIEWGIPTLMLANSLVQRPWIELVAHALEAGTRVLVWADDLETVRIMSETLAAAGATRELELLVELGQSGGRTGARTLERGLDIARAVAAAPALRLAGVTGYEGALAHEPTAEALDVVRGYLRRLVALHESIRAEGLYPDGEVILSAGGSAYFDVVAEVLAPERSPGSVEVVLRSGAYLTHDDGFYRMITPMNRIDDAPAVGGTRGFRSALAGWASVVSAPEPGLVLVDAGKRDFPFDEGLPEPQGVVRDGEFHPFSGRAEVSAMNDQHTFVRIAEGAEPGIGEIVRFGLSHPCTTFDKWQALPLIDRSDAHPPRVTGLIRTEFG